MDAEKELPLSHNENRRPKKIRIFLLFGALIALIAFVMVFWVGLLVWLILYLIRFF
jgi:fatty acid desaturase